MKTKKGKFNTPFEVFAIMCQINTGSQTGKKHKYPQNRNQYSSSRTASNWWRKEENKSLSVSISERKNKPRK